MIDGLLNVYGILLDVYGILKTSFCYEDVRAYISRKRVDTINFFGIF